MNKTVEIEKGNVNRSRLITSYDTPFNQELRDLCLEGFATNLAHQILLKK
jgi:hypothetical protein